MFAAESSLGGRSLFCSSLGFLVLWVFPELLWL